MELQKGMEIRDEIQLQKLYEGLTTSEALDTVKQSVTALATRLRR